MRWIRASAVRVFLILPLFSACHPGREPGGAGGPIRPTLSSIQARVFDRSCARAGCHLGASTEPTLSLRSGDSHRSLVGVPSVEMRSLMRVAPGDPDGSYLIRKLEGGPIVGERMPMGADPLPPEAIAVIRAWIAGGAPDD